jgi:hypothetical protein
VELYLSIFFRGGDKPGVFRGHCLEEKLLLVIQGGLDLEILSNGGNCCRNKWEYYMIYG